jgi:hypothetical protein
MLQGGSVRTYGISGKTLAQDPVVIPARLPFSINEDVTDKDVFLMSDVSTGYAAYRSGSNATVVQSTIPLEAAVCWGAQSSTTKSYYLIDIGGKSNITEVALDVNTLHGSILSQHSLGVNASGTDVSIFSAPVGEWMYVNAPAYKSIHVFKISGPGQFKLSQQHVQ